MFKLKPWIFVALGTVSLAVQAAMPAEVRSVQSAFDAIDIAGNNQVFIKIGATTQLEVSCQQDPAQVVTEVKDRILYIYEKNAPQNPLAKPLITVAVPKLVSINTAGEAIVTVSGMDAEALQVNTNGKSQMTIQGVVEHFYLQAKGKSEIDALQLKAKQADIETFGKSTVQLNVADKLKVTSYGKAHVYYSGTPKVTPIILGQGEVKPMSNLATHPA